MNIIENPTHLEIKKKKEKRKSKKMSTPQQERKRIGLVIGIEYWLYANHNIADSLPGCHRDAKHMYNLLKKYKYDKIVIMIDDDATPPELQPTRKNILQMIATLAREAENADLFISNASHGSQLPDNKKSASNFEVGDEPDNMDETLVPLDYLGSVDAKGKLIPSENQIRDDELKRILVDNLHPTSRLVFFSDSCHSSSILDLPYVYNLVDTPKEKDSVILKESSESNSVLQYPCPVMCLSGCKDNQTSLSVVNETTKGLKGLANTNEKVKIVTRGNKVTVSQQQTVIIKNGHNGQNIANKKVPARAVGAFRDERDSVTWEGAATFSLLTALEFLQYRGSWPTVFKNVRKVLQDKGYEQKPMLSSSMHLGQMQERELQDLYFATWEVDESVSRDPMPRYTTNSQKGTTI